MLPYTVIKEANRPEFGGTATGVVNFLNFTFSALLGPVFGRILQKVSGGASQMTLEHYQAGFEPLLYGVAIAIVLTFCLEGDRTCCPSGVPVNVGYARRKNAHSICAGGFVRSGLVLGARVPVILTSRADSVRARTASCAVAMLAVHARREQP